MGRSGGCAALALFACASCLAAPPDSTGGGDDDAGPGGSDASVDEARLLGIDTRGDLDNNGRDDVILGGEIGGAGPIAFVLGDTESGLEESLILPVPLPDGLLDMKMSPWGPLCVVVCLLKTGELVAFDDTRLVVTMNPTVDGEQVGHSFDNLAVLGGPSARLILIGNSTLYASELVGTGEPDDPLALDAVFSAPATALLAADHRSGTLGIGIVSSVSNDLDVFELIDGVPPTLGADLAESDTLVASYPRAAWLMTDGPRMTLLAIDPAGPEIRWHQTPMVGGETASDDAVSASYDAIHDIMVARIATDGADVVVLGERDGDVVVDLYPDPIEEGEVNFGVPIEFTLGDDFQPGVPLWLQSMALGAIDQPGRNEVVVYDQAGHLACVDYTDDEAFSCGAIMLPTVTDASTSGRPGW